MKVCFLIFVVFGAYSSVSCSLRDDYIDILAVIPVDQIEAIFTDAVQNDPDVQDFLIYFQSDEFMKLYQSAEFKEIVNNEQFAEVIDILNSIPELQAIFHYAYTTFFEPQQVPPKSSGGTKSLRSVFDSAKALIDVKAVAEIFLDKLQSSPEYLDLYQRIQALEDDFDALINLPPIRKALQMYKEYGIHVDSFIKAIRTIFGWKKEKH